jgi:hypothetical protein
MATIWKGVDPKSRLTAPELRTQLQGYLGRPVTADDALLAQQHWGLSRPLAETDVYTGEDVNSLFRYGAPLAGGTFQDWQNPLVTNPQQGAVDAALAGAGVKPATTPPPAAVAAPPPMAAPTPFVWDEIPAAPTRQVPGQFDYEDFTVPGMEGMYADPGYQERVKQANRALEASKAAKGMYRSGETIDAIARLNQGLASQEYGNVFNRALTTHTTNRDAALDEWDRALMTSDRIYEPEMATWSARANQVAGRNIAGFNQQWEREQFGRGDEWRAVDHNVRMSEIDRDNYWKQSDADFRDRETARDEKWRETDDAHRKEVYRTDDAFRKAVFGSDDQFRRAVQAADEQWKKDMLEEERLRFLASLGR